MKISDLNPFVPPRPEVTQRFVESVQPLAPPVHRQIIDTVKQVAKALGLTGATIVTSPLAVAEGGLYAAANVLAMPSVILNKLASITNAARTRIFHTIMGSGGHSASLAAAH
jgi:hypothetical protein